MNFVSRLDPRYIWNLDISCEEIKKIIKTIPGNKKFHGIGLLNLNKIKTNHWKQLIPNSDHVLHLDYAEKNVTWDTLYPEWIDEEQQYEIPICQSLPKIEEPKKRLDLIIVKLPCRDHEANWSTDVARLHLQLAAAQLAVSKQVLSGNIDREAYATILHSADIYVCGAIAAARSIRMTGSTRDLIILVDETISKYHRGGLEAAGWKIRTIQRIRNPKPEKNVYNEWNYSKFRLWQLADYDKIIFIDADSLVLRNIDFLFSMPEISAAGNQGMLFNSGVMVIEPSNCTFQLLMDHVTKIDSYSGGDQGYLNEIFTWWHRIPKHMNFLKNFWSGDDEAVKGKKTRLFGAEPPILYVLHFVGYKPWRCFPDYDCNWNVDFMQEFASDVAHEKWWKVHDEMPGELQQFCMSRAKHKAQLEWDRREAEKGKYADGHWRRKVEDPRLKKCVDELCSWKYMLLHWRKTKWTDDEFVFPSPPYITKASLSRL
ncbi:hypothetical protein RHMOL_Rhmol10G0196700 [Rhododendron molle]|uniref:Uncharacterized protein n=1 Tax=Rhododendron molle TaxID=49168 RepID=A0ACC0M443_RHOML|nr:hypothetical protein RHMOL_Rhmol10G0196700 [Rhododendron molle]